MPKTKLNCHDQSNMVWCKMKMSQEYDVIDSSPIGVVRIFKANPTYDNHLRVGVNRVMVSFRKFKQVNARDNYMQVYNNQYIDNCT